ncbi:hypothetical protein [Brucella intermedia]|uniref:hypothetical protein n=1 Tax=Brucella intermedia TaxID=94625 RepID=UPI00158907FF|nr:hypothetical protein [Brucella intermedia]NYD84312.1 hypothetical protein [Brucella intermedia]
MGNQKALQDGKSVVADKDWLAQRDGGAFSAPSNSLDAFKIAVQHHIDSVAQSMGYDNAANLASYVNSTVPGWGGGSSALCCLAGSGLDFSACIVRRIQSRGAGSKNR